MVNIYKRKRDFYNILLKSYLVRLYDRIKINCLNIINKKEDYEGNKISKNNNISTIGEIYTSSENSLTFCRLLYLKYKFNDGDKVNIITK